MTAHDGQSGSVTPAQLSFLAIYNPSLGNTDETLHDQIVFYWSRKNGPHKRQGNHTDEGAEGVEDRNEKLRRIGLAQGMVEFARSFSGDESIDSVETEKSRIVLHELEPGWWILASIDLTRLAPSGLSAHTAKTASEPARPTTEFSAREVSPPHLLITQLCRAHASFLLHHATSLGELYSRIDGPAFYSNLYRFWGRFVRNWDVLLHGNPSVDIFAAIKLAGGGELGMGVGEEDRGSGEREVLEGFVGRIEGLVDLVVSRFGDPPFEGEDSNEKGKETNQDPETQQWGGPSALPSPTDGAIFLGIGTLARTSLRDITNWMEELYELGEDAYCVNESPSSTRRRKRRKPGKMIGPKLGRGSSGNTHSQHRQSARAEHGISAGKKRNDGNTREISQQRIPPPIVSTVESTVLAAAEGDGNKPQGEQNESSFGYGSRKFMKYLTLGYSPPWRTAPLEPRGHSDLEIQAAEASDSENTNLVPIQHIEPQPDIEPEEGEVFIQKHEKTIGHFLIGLKGDVEDDRDDAMSTEQNASKGADTNTRILQRTVQVKMEPTYRKAGSPRSSLDQIARDSSDVSTPISAKPARTESANDPHKRGNYRVVVYVYQPFIFTFLFEPNTECLSSPTFYRSLHHQLGPLQRPLLSSTSSTISPAINTDTPISVRGSQPIYDLIYDPKSLTIYSSIPTIPLPALLEDRSTQADAWARVEALSVHQQILNIFTSTRHRNLELERTCKTSRGWWVVWMKLPNLGDNPTSNGDNKNSGLSHKEAMLVRKSSDYAPRISSLGYYGKDGAGGSASGVVGLVEGIGIDTRKYIESLLSLNR
ncbi:MAG: hypothetical protein M1840_006147 [Geoglossum simile]|nr:MAG: hypothetical protein M1840_006147 [Geoglossum simile]